MTPTPTEQRPQECSLHRRIKGNPKCVKVADVLIAELNKKNDDGSSNN